MEEKEIIQYSGFELLDNKQKAEIAKTLVKQLFNLENELQAYREIESELKEYLENLGMTCHCGQNQQERVVEHILQMFRKRVLTYRTMD